ncbi:hypothetical protein [Cobetia sp. 1AS1]|uniref:hypothetical protein n=1 Tax=Cobetia sp. 1AS1 TaxID=3040016 RepID=UPI002446FAFF|nr:hypothetical protein [Cobetia sp. 1AS1]MDH2296039.1 hypothetical protein [Cobetia sp. 1AS1]
MSESKYLVEYSAPDCGENEREFDTKDAAIHFARGFDQGWMDYIHVYASGSDEEIDF